jgi:hypothetical protein
VLTFFIHDIQTTINGTSGTGRGFVLIPSSSPSGREIKSLAMDNYKIMIEEIEKLS